MFFHYILCILRGLHPPCLLVSLLAFLALHCLPVHIPHTRPSFSFTPPSSASFSFIPALTTTPLPILTSALALEPSYGCAQRYHQPISYLAHTATVTLTHGRDRSTTLTPALSPPPPVCTFSPYPLPVQRGKTIPWKSRGDNGLLLQPRTCLQQRAGGGRDASRF